MNENRIPEAIGTELERSGNGVPIAPPVPAPDITPEDTLAAPEANASDDFAGTDMANAAAMTEEVPPAETAQQERQPRMLLGRGKGGPRRRGPRLVKPEIIQQAKTTFTVEQKLLILDTWERSGLPAGDFAVIANVPRQSLYKWRHDFDELGPEGLSNQKRGAPKGSKLPEATKRAILMLKETHPEYGCQRISDMLFRGMAIPASASAVANLLKENGYETEMSPTKPHAPAIHRFERAKPNQLWQTDLFTFILKRQNRRVYMVAFMDDNSRFITGYGIHASQSGVLVIEVLRAAITAYGTPHEILTDNGAQYATWRGTSAFTKEAQRLGIHHILATPKRPQTLGKIERFWGTMWRECVETAIFIDLEDARKRIGLFIDHYNFQRPHSGIDGLVPADRFFNAVPEVLRTLRERVAVNAFQLAKTGIPKPPLYLTGNLGGEGVSLHSSGDKVYMIKENGEKMEVDMSGSEPIAEVPPPEELPAPVCPHGAPGDGAGISESEELPPGASPLDDYIDDGSVEANCGPEADNTEGGADES